jgi:RHS repeat-associated protein
MTNANGIANLATTNRLRLDFAYDYLGRRVQKIVSTWGTTNFVAQATNRFVYDGWNLLAVVNPQSAILQSFMWGQDISGTMADAGGIGGLLLANIGGTNCFAAYDGNGNITSLINATDKSLAARYEYSPYGELLRETGLLAHQMPFRFSTKFWDEESGLVYYGYRYYSSQLGRWISKDPNEEQDAINLFLAFKNSAINQIDTDGRGLFNSPKVAAVFAALATFLRAEESGNPSRGPMNDWARNMKREAQAMSESASRNMRGGSGAGGRGKPPHDYSNGGRGIVLGLAISGLYAFSESLLAAANVALGERSEQGTAGYTLESAMIHYNRGDEAWGDLDAIDAALQMSGGAGEDALIMFSVMSEAGEMFQ